MSFDSDLLFWDSTWDMIKTEIASRIQTSIEDSKQKRNLTEILLFVYRTPVVPFLICSFKQYFGQFLVKVLYNNQ